MEETSRLVELFRSSDRAVELDVPDLVDWMPATGCRIGEALALRYGPDPADLDRRVTAAWAGMLPGRVSKGGFLRIRAMPAAPLRRMWQWVP